MRYANLLLYLTVLCTNLCVGYNLKPSDVYTTSEEDVSESTEDYLNCTNCTYCPRLGQLCTGCCSPSANSEIVCFNGVCTDCYINSRWICSNHVRNQEMLFTVTQIAMSAALILGIITILVLLWKICTGTGHRPLAGRTRSRRVRESGRSVDTLQQIVSERLRDAPPPYVGTILPPPGDTPPPYNSIENNLGHVNACFDPDYNADPPSYNSITVSSNQTPNRGVPKNDTRNPSDNVPKATDNSSDSTLHI